jgi:hypothetical protein
MKTKKARVIRNLVQAAVVVGLGYLVKHKIAETHDMVWVAAGWLLSAWVALRIAMALKRGFANFRTHTATGVNLENIDKLTTAAMHPWMRGYYAIEKKAYRGFWRTVTRKPLEPAGDFSVAAGSNSRMLAFMLMTAVAVAAALCWVVLPNLFTGFWPRLFAFGGAGGALLYAAIWIIGDRRNLKEGGHRIGDGELVLDLGIRCAGVIALDGVAGCSVLERGLQKATAADHWIVSPGEHLNVLIELKETTLLHTTAFGSPRDISKKFVALYVDQPAAFVNAVSQASADGQRAASA